MDIRSVSSKPFFLPKLLREITKMSSLSLMWKELAGPYLPHIGQDMSSNRSAYFRLLSRTFHKYDFLEGRAYAFLESLEGLISEVGPWGLLSILEAFDLFFRPRLRVMYCTAQCLCEH